MNLDAAWARAQSASFALQGVPATVTRPAPDDTAVVTRGIWFHPLNEPQPFGHDFNRRDPRKVLVLPRDSSLPNVPKGTTIVAPETQGGTSLTWRVEGYSDTSLVDEWRVIVVPVTDF
jgi:hypothetical protein